MKIAVIDEGVIPTFKDELNIVEDLMVNDENLVVNREDDVQVITDHGLNVCKIINMYAPEAEIISIRIFSTIEMKTSIENLIAAFKYCLDKEIPIIHLSGGTVNLFDDYLLRDVIKEIINNNQIIVAAHSNKKGISFPAFYPCVFSARADELFNSYCEVNDRWGYSFAFSSNHKIRLNKNINYITQIANSYAAPVLTAKIYNILSSKNHKRVILNELGMDNNIFLCESPFFLDDVTIINLGNKIILEKILPFKIKNIYYDIEFEANGRDYIFIPYNDKEINIIKFKEFLNVLPIDVNRIRIFYLGTSDNDIEAIMKSYPFEFWLLPDEDIYPIGISNADLSDCATIYFQGDKENVYYIMAQLRDVFLEDGFNCFAISDYLEATLYGIYYFKDLVNSSRKTQLEYALEPDVELVYSKNKSYREIEDSMLIKVVGKRNRIKLLISVGNAKEEVDIYSQEDFEVLLSRIINMVQ